MTNAQPTVYNLLSVDKVVHGIGSLSLLADLLDERHAGRAVVVSTKSIIDERDMIGRVVATLGPRFVGLADPIGAHTPAEAVDQLEVLGKAKGADALIAIGGSSVSDAAKIAALRLTGATPAITITSGSLTSGGREADSQRPMTVVTIPTTLSAGEYRETGGMVDGRGAKIAVMDDRMMAHAVILDPIMTLATPSLLWASSAIKALDHAAEAIWGHRSHPLGDILAVDAIGRLVKYLPITLKSSDNLEARLECQLASWMSIFSMKNTLNHLSHIIERNMGSYWHLPHGITSCIALPVVMDYLASENPAKVSIVAHALLGDSSKDSSLEIGKQGAAWLTQWIQSLGLPTRLREVLSEQSGFENIARQSVSELERFGYIPTGREATIVDLLERMW